MNSAAAILPGATLGVLGGGQLGRMFAIAARRLGYRVHVLVPDRDTPTGQVADVEVRAGYDDLDAVAEFARGVDVVTFEFENVSTAATEAAVRHAPVRPAGHVLHTTQNRVREKTWLRDHGLPTTSFAPVENLASLTEALIPLGAPAVLKSAAWGYDGRGQVRLDRVDHAEMAWTKLDAPHAILEAFIDYQCELSVVVARGLGGECAFYGPMRNDHSHHILDVSVCPADVPQKTATTALEITRAVAEAFELVGVLCVEFFLTRDDNLLINEIAPRPHNSGHLTIDGHVCCQFAQQVRTICGLPLGSSRQRCPVAMSNLLGDLWHPSPPVWANALAHPDARLHLYGKAEPRPGRKMGHITALGKDAASARELALAARASLRQTS